MSKVKFFQASSKPKTGGEEWDSANFRALIQLGSSWVAAPPGMTGLTAPPVVCVGRKGGRRALPHAPPASAVRGVRNSAHLPCLRF